MYTTKVLFVGDSVQIPIRKIIATLTLENVTCLRDRTFSKDALKDTKTTCNQASYQFILAVPINEQKDGRIEYNIKKSQFSFSVSSDNSQASYTYKDKNLHVRITSIGIREKLDSIGIEVMISMF